MNTLNILNTLPNPTNINDARRLANSYAKAQQILEDGYTFTDELQDGTLIAVCKPGKLAASYWIQDGECDCPDFLNRGTFCKHTLALQIQRKREEEEAAMWAEVCALYDAQQALEA